MTQLPALRSWIGGLALAGSALLAACGGGSDDPPPPPPAVGTVSGVVSSSATGAPLAGVAVQSGSRSTQTAADGGYTLTDVPAGDPAVVSFTLAGHAKGTASVALARDGRAAASPRLVPIGSTQTIDAAAGGTVAVANSPAQVVLPAAGLVTPTGGAPSGAVTVEVTPINPAADPDSMPGNFTAAGSGGARVSIESFGALNVTLRDAAGAALNLAAGKTATLRIPLATRAASAPATIPLFWFNEQTGLWVEEGSATLAGTAPNQYYEGTVSHFTTWNADIPYDTIQVIGCVQDGAGAPVAGVALRSIGVDYSGTGFASSAADGRFQLPMRRGGTATVFGEAAGRATNSVRAGPSQANITLTPCLVLAASGQPPQIVQEPRSQSILLGGYALFQVQAIGTQPLRYQWQRNGADIAGATSSVYLLLGAQAADDGARLRVVVSNPLGSVTSAEATLSVDTTPQPPLIQAQPQPVTVSAGQTASFSVSAVSQGGTLSYQWRKGGVNIAGASAASYTTPATVLADNGAPFSVVIASSNGTSVTSADALLTVNAPALPPVITTQPQSTTVVAGQTATFSVAAQAQGPGQTLSYQWRKNGTAIAGATAASYTTPAASAADNGAQFSVVVASSNGTSVTSDNATLSVNVPPLITAQPQPASVIAGQTATFSVTAQSQGGTLSYQWRRDGTAIAGATAASYTTPATTLADSGAVFSVVVASSNGTSVTSNNAGLTVNAAAPPTITAQPQAVAVTVGQTASFSVTAQSPGNTLTYQWRKDGTNIAGATAASYTTPATTPADNGARFSVVVTSSNGASATSADALLTVNAIAPQITQQPVAVTVNVGQSASFSVTASGTAPLTYQWRKNGAAIAGATAASYTTPAAVLADNGALFSVVVGNGAGSVTSANAQLTVNAVTPAGHHLLAAAGPETAASANFANGARSFDLAAVLVVNQDNPTAGAVTLEPAGTALPLEVFVTGTLQNNQVTAIRTKYTVYIKGGRFYRFDHGVSGTPGGQLISTLTTNEVCADNGGSLNAGNAFDIVAPERGWLFARGPGADNVCFTADDMTRAVRMNMSATDTALTIPGWAEEDIRAANGALTGQIFIAGTQVVRRDAELANPVNLFTLSAPFLLGSEVAAVPSFPGIWVFADGATVYAVDLASPGTRTPVATLQTGERLFAGVELASDGSKLYVPINNATASPGSGRIVAVTPGTPITATQVATFQESMQSIALTPTRIVVATPSGVVSLPKAGGTSTPLFTRGTSDFGSFVITAAENVYWPVFNTGTLAARIEVADSAGANRQTLADTSLFAFGFQSSFPVAFDFGRFDLLYLASPAALNNQAGATLRSFDARTRQTLTTYGSLPAAPPGQIFPDQFALSLYGDPQLFTYRRTDTPTANSDLYFIDTDVVGLVKVTSFLPAAAASSGPVSKPQAAAQLADTDRVTRSVKALRERRGRSPFSR